MKVYLYDNKTFEYLASLEADKDPEESKLQNKFVPLIPANATLIAPPEYSKNKIPVFNGESWTVCDDYRYSYSTVDEDMKITEITEIGTPTGIIVSNELCKDISQNPKHYKIVNNKVIKKTNEEIIQEQISDREKLFKSNFFETSIGWIRRKVSMGDGSIKDFLTDLLLPIKAGLEIGQDVKVITYKLPDFSQELTEDYVLSLQEIKSVTSDFVSECLRQTVEDFWL